MNLDIDFYHQLKEVFIQKELSRKEKVQQKLFQDIPRETINYLENVSKVHQALLCCKDININQKDIKVYSLLLGVLSLQEDNISLFFRSLEFDSMNIYSYLNIKTYPLDLNQFEIDVDLLSNQYGMYIFGGKNQNRSRKELTIKAIASNIFNQELNNSISIAKFLNTFHHSYEEFEDFDSLYEKWQNTKRENDRLEAIKQSILKYNSVISDYIFMVLRIHHMIKRELETGKIQQTLIQIDDDIEKLSFLLALRIKNASSWQFFGQRGLTTEKILQQCGLRLNLLDNVAKEFLDYDLFETNYQKYFVEDSRLLEPKNVTMRDLTKKIFDFSTNHSQILEKICTNLDIRYDILQLEVENEKPYEQILSIDQRIQLLSNEQVSHIDLSDITSILNFGNSLVIHSNYIHNELPKLVLSDTHDSAIQEMNHMIENTYSIESLENSKKSFWSKIFHTQENQESQMVFDSEKIKKLQQTIEQNIEALSKEIVGYDNIRKYIEAYRQKNNTHFLIAQEAEKKIQEKLQKIDPEQDNQYSEFLATNSQLQMIHNKVNRFATTNQLMRQELLSINQTIVNHFITINALEMARDDLMPLIGSELAISQGRITEGQGMELTKNVMSLFQTLLSRNLSGALVQMQQLQNHLISSDTLAILNGDIKHYLNEVNQAQNIQNRVETLATDQISLDVDFNLTEKSPLENGSSDSTSQKKLKK